MPDNDTRLDYYDMRYIETNIPNVLVIDPDIHEDSRGFFLETFQANKFNEFGLSVPFVQDNLSGSHQGVLRGLHYQKPNAQGKYVRAIVGEIFDVCVDLRRSSDTFGNWYGMRLSSWEKIALWIPPECAHGFYVLSEWAEVLYKTTDYYAPESERTIIWNDPELKIDWPLIDGQAPVLSKKDASGMRFHEMPVFE